MDEQLRARHSLDMQLRKAIEQHEVETRFLPTMDLQTGRVVAFEIQPYWRSPTAGQLGPQRLVAIAEEAGLSHELMEHTLRDGCAAPPTGRSTCTWPSTCLPRS